MRDKLAEVKEQVTIQGPIYRALDAIAVKIDDLAEWLTGERSYCTRGNISHIAHDEEREHWRRWDTIEKGEEPWPKDGRP